VQAVAGELTRIEAQRFDLAFTTVARHSNPTQVFLNSKRLSRIFDAMDVALKE
jgi:hypothetical protein